MGTHGRAPRLRGWDYTRCGGYFVTLVVRGRVRCLRTEGRADGDLTAEGEAVLAAWGRIGRHFERVRLDEIAIMPDHVRGIIWLYECPRIPVGLGAVMKAWKGYATQEIRTFAPEFGWQIGYYDRIVRDRVALERIRRYIRTNHIRHGGDAP